MSVHLYVVGYEHATFGHAIKVGIAANVGARIASLQTGNPDRLDLYFSLRFETRQIAAEVERLFHESELSGPIRGEWVGGHPHETIFYLCCITARVLRSNYPGPTLSEERKKAGLLEGFGIIDYTHSDLQENWNERFSGWEHYIETGRVL